MDPIFSSTILLWPGERIPNGYMVCAGQTLMISGNEALYSLLGTTYGGDGLTTFCLPNLCGRVPVGAGQGPGLKVRELSDTGGEIRVQLRNGTIPAHTHTIDEMAIANRDIVAYTPTPTKVTAYVPVNAGPGSSRTPGGGLSFAQAPDTETALGAADNIYGPADPAGTSIPLAVDIPGGESITIPGIGVSLSGISERTGDSLYHENRQQYVVLKYIICVQGDYPFR